MIIRCVIPIGTSSIIEKHNVKILIDYNIYCTDPEKKIGNGFF